ncbi:MAG: prepilin-type N-terminal cleavage/methylation domain-containing protein [Planctomycetales bacterium]|nr:prepilin-type N-terminal cleavage/methylation domain-containing protein [Planctomycetales bacterium]
MPITSSSFRTRGRTDFRSRVAGFTLVEMLVAVALVLLMMSIFAQIFQMATGSLSQQRGIAENDQRGRFLTTTLRADLDQRTFRDVLPFRANEDTQQLGDSLSRRRGYFSIDENDPSDDTDDVLSLTASVNIKSQNAEGSPFTGRAKSLSGVPITGVTSSSQFTVGGNYTARIPAGSRIWIAGSSGTGVVKNNDGLYFVSSAQCPSGTTTITIDVNMPPRPPPLFPPRSLNTSLTQQGTVYLSESEPEFDDGVFGNDTAVSSAAEVCYFLRNNVLYRRVLLIREPASGVDAQPTWTDTDRTPILGSSNKDYQPSSPSTATTTFWRDFDYSAFNLDNGVFNSDNGVRFHNVAESLSNSAIVTPFKKVAISAVPSNSSIRILNTATLDYGPLIINGSGIWIAAGVGGNTGLYTIQSSTSSGKNGNTTINLTSNTLNTSPPRLGEVYLLDRAGLSLGLTPATVPLILDRSDLLEGAGFSLGLPRLRFGHNPTTGLPQDGATAGADGIWGNADDTPVTFRRFNLQECSHLDFVYPGYIPDNPMNIPGNPINAMTRTDLTLVPNNGRASAGLVTQYSTGISRRGEDILMSNVLSFDVKVWDPVNSQFVDVGDSTIAAGGPFSSTAPDGYGVAGTLVGGRLNRTYGPGHYYRPFKSRLTIATSPVIRFVR